MSARGPKLIEVAHGVRAEFRTQSAGSIVYVLFDKYSRAIGCEEVVGTETRAHKCAKAFATELIAAHAVAQ